MDKIIRCAVYTRKSSEDGLEQDFNSLDAQREACTAYIASQRHEGWQLVPEAYDDGGFSGGNIERPALQRLFADIRAGMVDTIVVYKIDRLTRSLADFAKMVELFDTQKVTFVAVTQQFNTTTSMGRLTLNVLLSFAQFEREVTGERIRDKIAASKAKGMWMGGSIPLGYDLVERKLVINPSEADLVRHIFRLYLETGSVQQVQEAINAVGHRTKQRGERQGRPFTQGNLANMLVNPLYHGQIRHKGKVYEGLHEAIVPDELWQAVQLRRKEARKVYGNRTHATSPSLLAGRLFDAEGHPMSPSHGNRNGRRYRYYVSQAVIQGLKHKPETITKIPAHDAESLICGCLLSWFNDPTWLQANLYPTSLDQLKRWQDKGNELKTLWSSTSVPRRQLTIRSFLKRVELSIEGLCVDIALPSLVALLNGDNSDHELTGEGVLNLHIPAKLKSLGKEKRLIIHGENHHKGEPNPELLKAVSLGHSWRQMLVSGQFTSLKELAENLKLADTHVGRYIQLGLLAPDIVEAILVGNQPLDLTVRKLYNVSSTDWPTQRRQLGFAN